ncbi:MAG: hypothetical protein ABW171_08215 [Steroidobacter sp.]
MDRKYIENEHIVDRYLSGDLVVREAREFEQFCLDNPQFLSSLPIPAPIKARLARRSTDDGEFAALPSGASRAAMDAAEDGFDPDEAREEMRRSAASSGASRVVLIGLVATVLVAAGAAILYALRAGSLSEQLQGAKKELTATQMQAPGSIQKYRIQLAKTKPDQPTVALGWLKPPQLLDITVDVSEGKMTQFQITVDKTDGVRVMQIRRLARDSNKQLRFSLNSSAFGPGDYLVKVDAYNWRGQIDEYGWMMLGLR